eukprot:gene16399-20953_t
MTSNVASIKIDDLTGYKTAARQVQRKFGYIIGFADTVNQVKTCKAVCVTNTVFCLQRTPDNPWCNSVDPN